LEAVVFAGRAVEHLLNGDGEPAHPETSHTPQLPLWRAEGLENLVEHAPLKSDRDALQATMSDDVGLVRSNARLLRAKRRITFLTEEIEMLWRTSRPTLELVELRNMGIVAGLVTEAALARRENIGLHHNIDLE
jgi:L-aspartate oxidase